MTTAEELEHMFEKAAAFAERPAWESCEFPGRTETLRWIDDDSGRRICAVTLAGQDEAAADDNSDAEYLEVSPDLAARLLADHLQTWLARRGWQVQADFCRGEPRWRLVDCVAFADGGGDRLDVEYPCGPHEFQVLCASVVAVATGCSAPIAIDLYQCS